MKTKILLIILLIYSSNLHSQISRTKKAREAKEAKEAKEIREYVWGRNDWANHGDAMPEKWKNESTVILYKQLEYSYRNIHKQITFKTLSRFRIKLMDKNAVEEYSTFRFEKYFYSDKGTFVRKKSKIFLGVKVVKPDGKEIIIDVDKESVKEDDETKLAIPNLEVGDIIDYYYYRKEPFISTKAYAFDPVEVPLVSEYPIVNYKISLDIENDFYINFRSLNGAPKLKTIPTIKENFTKYKLVAKNLDKKKFPKWYFPMTGYPALKFQVYFVKNKSMKKGFEAFLADKKNTIKANVTKEDVLNLYSKLFKPVNKLKHIQKYLKNKNFSSQTDKIKTAFYYMRHIYATQYREVYLASKNDYISRIYGQNIPYKNEIEFINYFTGFLKNNKIPYEIILGIKRYNGDLKNLLIADNLQFLVKVNTTTPIYVSGNLSRMSTISYIDPYLEGTDVYILKSSPGSKKLDKIEIGKLPVSKYTDNETNEEVQLILKPDFSGFYVNVTDKFNGHFKPYKQFKRLVYSDYLFQDFKRYHTKTISMNFKYKGEQYTMTYDGKTGALIYDLIKAKKKYFEDQIKSDWDLSEVNNYDYRIISPGRFSPSSYLEYQQIFDFDNKYIKRAGPNYLIEIGQFIGSQIEIEDKDRKLEENIYLSYPKILNTTIKLKIPEGYKVVGLDKLQKHVDNSSGAFISTPRVKNNELIIYISKQYKHNYYPNEKWSEILAFIDEANQFKNEKILLKKI